MWLSGGFEVVPGSKSALFLIFNSWRVGCALCDALCVCVHRQRPAGCPSGSVPVRTFPEASRASVAWFLTSRSGFNRYLLLPHDFSGQKPLGVFCKLLCLYVFIL